MAGEKKHGGLFQGILDGAKKTVSDIKLPDVKLPDIKEIKLPDVKLPDVKLPELKIPLIYQNRHAEHKEPLLAVTARGALKIIYYLMAADGQIFHNEEEEYDEIGHALDPRFVSDREGIVAACEKQLDNISDPDERFEALKDGIRDAIAEKAEKNESVISPKVLAWDMLTVAYSDGQYDENERKLLKYAVRKLDIDEAVILEMEMSFQTMMDLENELSWIKTTDRPYLKVGTMVSEIEKRKKTIFDSIKELIEL